MKKSRDGDPVAATSSSPPRVGSPAVLREPGRAGVSDRRAVVRVVQAIWARLTLLVQRVRYCVRVVTHPRSWRLWEWGPRPVRWALVAEPFVLGWAGLETVRAVRMGVSWG